MSNSNIEELLMGISKDLKMLHVKHDKVLECMAELKSEVSLLKG